MAFIVLARNAFDVMMRRGWSVRKDLDGEWFCMESSRDGLAIKAKDPFTALVEADRWYKANVEVPP